MTAAQQLYIAAAVIETIAAWEIRRFAEYWMRRVSDDTASGPAPEFLTITETSTGKVSHFTIPRRARGRRRARR